MKSKCRIVLGAAGCDCIPEDGPDCGTQPARRLQPAALLNSLQWDKRIGRFDRLDGHVADVGIGEGQQPFQLREGRCGSTFTFLLFYIFFREHSKGDEFGGSRPFPFSFERGRVFPFEPLLFCFTCGGACFLKSHQRVGVGTELSFDDSESDIVEALRESAQFSANQAGQQIVERNLNIQPTIKIRPGWPLRIIVHKDLVLRPYNVDGVQR